MAAIHTSSRQQHPHSRLRSSSDPFVDPSPRHRVPPPPPPKSAKMPAAVPSSRDSSQHDITDAVRDTVVLRNDPRAKVSRSQTGGHPAAVSSSRPPGKRSQSEDSNIVEKPRASGKSRSKKGSQHADVIDRLDFTGEGAMFHHDGPFDACAPSRNKHRAKAPLYSWGIEEPTARSYGDSAYPSAEAYKAFTNDYPEPPKRKVDAIAEAWGIHEPEPFEEFFAGGGSGRPDGDTPSSSIYNGKESHQSTSRAPAANPPRRAKDTVTHASTRDSRDETRPRVAARRSLLPPPQPIFVGEPAEMDPAPTGSPPSSAPGFPKRSKSIMHRIRKMRDAPNVPVTADYEQNPPVSPSSPTEPMHSARPTHRPQNSFLGRFGGNGNKPPALQEKPEPFVFIDASTNNNKDLPPPPQPLGEAQYAEDSQAYFDGPHMGGPSSPGLGGGGLGRKSSLMKKVGRVVRGTK